jgi:hypothetical protein
MKKRAISGVSSMATKNEVPSAMATAMAASG